MAWAQAATGERVALVIGNAAYPTAPLENPRNDAQAMSELLRQAGFAVDSQYDTSQQSLLAAVERFGAAIRDPKVKFGLFYYAGHGLQLDWRNYLVPVNATIRKAADVPQQTVDVSQLLRYMGDAKGRSFLVILDACRDDPFGNTFRPPVKGLSQFDAPVGSMLAYATAPGSVAMDGTGANGLYTSNLLREFAVRGTRLEDAFKRVRLNVRLASRGQQIPWESTSLEEDVYLFPSERRKLSEAEQDQLLEKEIASWLRVKSTNDSEALANFIRDYPSGSASELAQARLNRLLLAQAQLEHRRLQTASQQAAPALPAPTPPTPPQAPVVMAAAPVSPPVRPAAAAAPAPVLAPPPAAVLVAAAAPVGIELPSTPFSKGYSEHQRNYRVGDVYGFRIVDGLTSISKPLVLRVTAVDMDADRVEFNNGEFASDTMGNTLATQRGSFSTPRQFYPAELYVGKKWHTMFKQARPSGISYTYRYEVKVVGRETITVPAGTFDAFKIEARGFNLQLGAALSRNIWVVPGIPADIAHETIVRLRSGAIEQFDRQELVSLTPGR